MDDTHHIPKLPSAEVLIHIEEREQTAQIEVQEEVCEDMGRDVKETLLGTAEDALLEEGTPFQSRDTLRGPQPVKGPTWQQGTSSCIISPNTGKKFF